MFTVLFLLLLFSVCPRAKALYQNDKKIKPDCYLNVLTTNIRRFCIKHWFGIESSNQRLVGNTLKKILRTNNQRFWAEKRMDIDQDLAIFLYFFQSDAACNALINNIRDENGDTLLIGAITTHNIKRLKILLSYPAIQCNKDSDSFTPLQVATIEHDYESMKCLIKHPDLKINVQDQDGCTAIHYAARNPLPQALKIVLSHPALNLDIQNRYGDTALHVAAQIEGDENMQLLIDARCNTLLINNNGKTALHNAYFSAEKIKNLLKLTMEQQKQEIQRRFTRNC
jgi:hypothetical protein